MTILTSHHEDRVFYARANANHDRFEHLMAQAEEALDRGDDNEFNRLVEQAKELPV